MSDSDSKIVGYVNAGDYETPQQAYDESEGWVTCLGHVKERVLNEFAALSNEYDETHDDYRPKDLLAWVLARYKGIDDLFGVTEEMIEEGNHNQCYECWSGWVDDLRKSSMRDAVARWENR